MWLHWQKGRVRALSATLLGAIVCSVCATGALGGQAYGWRGGVSTHVTADTLAGRFAPPAGFLRVAVPAGSFGDWLRGLPMKPAGSAVHLYNGQRKFRQDVHAGIIDIDVGSRDLQQCADAVMRLRAEWLFGTGRAHEIAFNYTGGGRVDFSRWSKGLRPDQTGKRWSKRGTADASHASLRRYMDSVFSYAGTYSLARELVTVTTGDVQIGDVFIVGGFPGHAVLVSDVAIHPGTGERRFLLVQSYMPAQEMHVLKNPAAADGSPWYRAGFDWPLATPEWSFPFGSHKKWPRQAAAQAIGQRRISPLP